MGKASLGKASNIIGINGTPAPATKELADTQSAVMGLAPCLELGGKPAKDNVLRHLQGSRWHHRLAASHRQKRLRDGSGQLHTTMVNTCKYGPTSLTAGQDRTQAPRGQVSQDQIVHKTRERTVAPYAFILYM